MRLGAGLALAALRADQRCPNARSAACNVLPMSRVIQLPDSMLLSHQRLVVWHILAVEFCNDQAMRLHGARPIMFGRED